MWRKIERDTATSDRKENIQYDRQHNGKQKLRGPGEDVRRNRGMQNYYVKTCPCPYHYTLRTCPAK